MTVKPERDDRCDRCGAPATNAACDMLEVTGPGDAWRRWQAYGPTKFGCDAHPAKSVEHDGRSLGL